MVADLAGEWCVTPCETGPPTEGVRVLYATELGEAWNVHANMVWNEATGEYCWEDDFDPAPGEVIYIVMVAYNSGGQSPTEHGSHYGAGYDPAGCP